MTFTNIQVFILEKYIPAKNYFNTTIKSTGIGANIFSLYFSLMKCFIENMKTIETIEMIRVAKLVLAIWLKISISS
jgi:hypothetical protein